MSMDARFLPFRDYARYCGTRIRELVGKLPIRYFPRSAQEQDAADYAKAVYHHKVARERMKQEGHITQI